MVNSNVMRAVGEALESHNIKPRAGERMAETVARGLHISETEAERWLEALDQGCTIEEANRRAGISTDARHESILVAIARSIGNIAGTLKAGGTPDAS